MNERDTSKPCPCGSQKTYADCCQPCHDGRRPATTAGTLMRSRYCAYALENWRYLYNSWDPQTRPTRKSLAKSTRTHWQGLDIIRTTAGGALDNEGTVEFKARWREEAGQVLSLHEKSRFRRMGGKWVYVDGEVIQS